MQTPNASMETYSIYPMASAFTQSFPTGLFNNTLNILSPLNEHGTTTDIPWQHQHSLGSLWQMIQNNGRQFQQPISLDTGQGSTSVTDSPWMPTNMPYQYSDSANQLQSMQESAMDDFEEMIEAHEELETQMEEEHRDTFDAFTLYILLLVPFMVFDKTTATYNAATKLLSFVLAKYGLNDEENMLFLLFVMCIDPVALARFKIKPSEGYRQRLYQKLYDYMLIKFDTPWIIRYGTQIFMMQTPGPKYITHEQQSSGIANMTTSVTR